MSGSIAAADYAQAVADIIRARGETHGDAILQHQILANLWSQYLRSTGALNPSQQLGADDAAFMLILLKISRVFAGGLRNQHVEDIAGYAAITQAALERRWELMESQL